MGVLVARDAFANVRAHRGAAQRVTQFSRYGLVSDPKHGQSTEGRFATQSGLLGGSFAGCPVVEADLEVRGEVPA
jgi:hypothetical protein